MKDNVDIGHLTKYDAFRMNRDQVISLRKQPATKLWTLKYGSKSM